MSADDIKKGEIVPFGKYKGQPVEVLAQDHAYCDWLTGQDWFRTRYTSIHTLIVNHFGQAAETPEHNLLQARFLDAQWCSKFTAAMGMDQSITATCNHFLETAQQYRLQRPNKYYGSCDPQIEGEEDLKQRLATTLWSFGLVEPTEFEVGGVDVVLCSRVYSKHVFPKLFHYDNHYSREKVDCRLSVTRKYNIECKPMISDDYPAILRQIKSYGYRPGTMVLLAGAVQSVVPLEQLRLIFCSSQIGIVTVEEVEQQQPRWTVEHNT